MRIVTTAGTLEVTQGPQEDQALVRGHKDSLQALVDGIEMSGARRMSLRNVVFNSALIGEKVVTKVQLATWIQFEILNFLTYTELPEGL